MGLEKLIEWLLGVLDSFNPFLVLPQYEGGIKLRLGKHVKTYTTPGLKMRIPFLEEILTSSILLTVDDLPEQYLTTKDNKKILLEGVLKYRVNDVTKFLLTIESGRDAITDITRGVAAEVITKKNLDEIDEIRTAAMITNRVQKSVEKHGILIDKYTISSFGEILGLKLFQNV